MAGRYHANQQHYINYKALHYTTYKVTEVCDAFRAYAKLLWFQFQASLVTYSSNSTYSICCGFVVQLVVQLVVMLWISCGFVVQLVVCLVVMLYDLS